MTINIDLNELETVLQIYALANISETVISYGEDKDSPTYSLNIQPSNPDYLLSVRLAETDNEKDIIDLYETYVEEAKRYNKSLENQDKVFVDFSKGNRNLKFIFMMMTKLLDNMPGSRQVLMGAIIDVAFLIKQKKDGSNNNSQERSEEISNKLPDEKQGE